MTLRTQRRFTTVRAAVVTAVIAGIACVSAVETAHATATNAGTVTLKVGSSVVSSGLKSTAFAVVPPVGAACSGDSLAGYRVSSFLAPVAQNLAALTLTSGAWNQAGVSVLYDTGTTPFVNQNTANNTGFLTGLPSFDLTLFDSTSLPAGTYRIGFACTNGTAGPNQLDKYWSRLINVASDQSWTVPTAPTAPAVPTYVNATGGSVAVSWAAPATGGLAISGYSVAISADGGTTWSTPVVTDSATTSHTFTGLTAATSYKVRVLATNLVGDSAWSTNLTASTASLSAPSAVSNIVATPLAGGTSLSLSWDVPADTGGAAISNYVVWYGSGASWRLATAASASTTLTGLAKNTNYNIIVAASNGTYYSPVQISAIASATTLATVPGTAGKPALTKGVKKITLKWTAPADNGGSAITAYRIQRSTNGTTWTTLTSAASASTRTYVATGLTTGKKYYFRVAAINAVGAGTYSAAANAIAG